MRLVQSMNKIMKSRVRVGSGYSEEFGVKVGVHQGSVLSPLPFIIVLWAFSREFLCEHGEDKDHGLWPQSEPSEKKLRRIRGVCQTGVGRNAVFCGGCLSWIHKKCSRIKGSLRRDHDFSCAGCLGKARPTDRRLVKETKQLMLYQSFVIWETCFLLAEVVNWLQSRSANRLRA